MKKFLYVAGVAVVAVAVAAAYRVLQENTGRDLWEDVLDSPL